jgi:membrane protein DedA with SNARE-associated domain
LRCVKPKSPNGRGRPGRGGVSGLRRSGQNSAMFDSMMAFLQSLQGFPAYALLFALLFSCGIGAPMNEDILLLAAAALTLKGVMEPVPLMIVSWFGLVLGDALVFHWGHRFGARMLRHRYFARVVPEARLASLQDTMRRYGPGYIFVVRFMPGIRTPLFFAAGSLKMPYRHLFIYDGAAALVELPLLVYGVRYVGGRWEEILALMQRFQGVLLPVFVLLIVGIWLLARRRAKNKAAAEEAGQP